MKPWLRWALFALLLVAVIAALSIYSLGTSPVTPPLVAPRVDAGVPSEDAPAVAPSGPATDGGSTRLLQPYPAGPLREQEVAFQVALLTLKEPLRRPEAALRRLVQREFPQLKVVTRPEMEVAPPSVYVSEARLEGLSFNEVTLFGRDLDHNTRVALTKVRKVLILEFHLLPGSSFDQVRRAHRIAHALGAPARAVLFDGETREYFSLREWKQRRIDSWGPTLPLVPLNISIQTHPVPGGQRTVTYGMAKFGLPDVLIDRHPPENGRALATVVNLICQTLVERAALAGEGKLELAVATLEEPSVRQEMLGLMRGNAAGRVELPVGLSAPRDRDPQNRLLELAFDPADPSPAQQQVIRALFGP